jgi:hypothetical protein
LTNPDYSAAKIEKKVRKLPSKYGILYYWQAVHVSGGFSAHHQELKNFTHSIWYVPGLLANTASVGEMELNHANGSSKQAWHITDAVCTVLELLMMGGETARNMYSLPIIKNIL